MCRVRLNDDTPSITTLIVTAKSIDLYPTQPNSQSILHLIAFSEVRDPLVVNTIVTLTESPLTTLYSSNMIQVRMTSV